MTSRERLICALRKEIPDRLPATTHHLMPYFLSTYMDGVSDAAFFDYFGLDAVRWSTPLLPNAEKGEYRTAEGHWLDAASFIVSDNWRVTAEKTADDVKTRRYTMITPRGALTMTLQTDEVTAWVTEYAVKEKSDIELLARYAPAPFCEVEEVNRQAERIGQTGIVRGHIPGFEIYGQPGTWQDAACLVGVEKLILETYDDPLWVHELLAILQERKKIYIDSLRGANYDLIELGGGDASSTVISPRIFEEFVAPYDSALIEAAHDAGQRIVYHTCGGMMPILELILAMQPDAMETFTPPGMGGDVDLAEAKKRLGDAVCMIGGFDQYHFLKDCTARQTRDEVRRCFEEAGAGGGYILCPSDHFFDAEVALLEAYAEEARNCTYESGVYETAENRH